MTSRPFLVVLCLLTTALSAAGQRAGSVRDFRFTVDTHPFLTLSNPALLDRFDGQVSLVQSHFRKENGGWLSPTESPDSWDAGASAQSYRRIGRSITFFGSLGWQHFTGKDMGGQILLDYTYNPVNFLESSDDTKGTKKRERYALAGAMSYRLSPRWAIGVQLNYTSADQTKTKDPRFSNIWMDLDLKAGASLKASDRWVLGLAFLFRNTLEQVKGGIYYGPAILHPNGQRLLYGHGIRTGRRLQPYLGGQSPAHDELFLGRQPAGGSGQPFCQ